MEHTQTLTVSGNDYQSFAKESIGSLLILLIQFLDPNVLKVQFNFY